MVHRALFIIVITLISSHLTQQQQNLCGTDGTRKWVDCPSNCHAYLWCNWDTSVSPPVLTSVHQLDCRAQGSTFFRPDDAGTSGVCTDNLPGCTAMSLCPPESDPEIMIANDEDPTCRQFRPCRNSAAPWHECRDPLVFNRNTGTCDFVERAPCTPHTGTPAGCPVGASGFFPGETCYSFILCELGEIIGTFNCGPGLIYDQVQEICVEDLAGACPRAVEIKKVKNVKTLTGLNRFLRAIHLN